MKRANGEGSIKRRRNGTWEGQYTITENGKRKRCSLYGSTQAEVRKKLSAVAYERDYGIFIKPSRMTVAEWFDIWIDQYLINIRPSTLSHYSYHGRVWIKPNIGHYPLQKVSPPLLQQFLNHSLKKLSPKSVKNLNGVLHRCFSQAIRCGYMRSNPCNGVVLPRVEKKEIHVIPGSKIREFLEIIKTDVFGNLYFVDLFTGMRQGEIIGLTWDCVDFDRGIIRIEKQLRKDHGLAGAQYGFSATKTGQKRVIRPADEVLTVLHAEKAIQARNALQHGASFCNAMNLVFTDEFGGHLKSHTVYSHLKKLLTQIGLGTIRFHDLRHTYATLSIQNGDDIKTVSRNLGHATTAFTLDQYAHVTDEMKLQSAERMNSFIQSLIG